MADNYDLLSSERGTRLEPRQVEVLKEIGKWLEVNGEAVYGTRGGPWLPTDAWASTNKGKKIYLHVMASEARVLQLPYLEGLKIKKAAILGNDSDVKVEVNGSIIITMPEILPSDYANVIELTTNGVFPEIKKIVKSD